MSRTGRPESTNPSMWAPNMSKKEYEEYLKADAMNEHCGNRPRNLAFKEAVKKFREITNLAGGCKTSTDGS